MTSIFGGLQSGLMDLLDPKPDPEWQDEVGSAEAPEAAEPKQATETTKPKQATETTKPRETPQLSDMKIHNTKPVVHSDALECDYTKNCTTLYKKIENAIEEREWEPIAKFLDTGYWPGSLFADEKGPKEQVMTWVTKFDAKDPTKVRWSQLPLHLAIVCGAPFSIVGRLIEHYPAGVRCTDDQRNLPIHLALRHSASDDVVTYLLMQFPESCNARGKERRTPIQCALRAPSKVRGKMLEIIVTKTKAKTRMELADAVGASNAEISDKESQISELQAELEAKTMTLAELEGKLAALDHGESLEELKAQKLAQILALEKKIEELESLNKRMLEAGRSARDKEASLLKDIELVTSAITTAKSSSELDKIKETVSSIALTRVATTKEELTKQIEAISSDIEASAKEMTEEEAKEIKASVEKLSSSAQNVVSTEDIINLRAEADEIGASLKEREGIAQAKAELALLKKAVEEEMKVEGKSEKEKATLNKALVSLEGVDKMSNGELVALKSQIVESRKAAQHQELAQKTQEDVLELSQKLEVVLMASEGESKEGLKASLEAVRKIQEELANTKTTEELLAVKAEVDALKKTIKTKVTIPADDESSSSKTEERSFRSFRSAQTGSTRKRKAKNRIKKFLNKIIGNRKAKEEASKDVSDEADLILPPCLSDSDPVRIPGKAPSASFEMPAEHTDTETDEEHPIDDETAKDDQPIKEEPVVEVEEQQQVPPSSSFVSQKSKKSMKSAKSAKSNKSTRSFRSSKSAKSKASVSSKTSVSAKVDAATGEVQIEEQSAKATAISL